MSDHIVKSFDLELTDLQLMIAQMGGLAEDQLAKSMEALVKRDAKLADFVIGDDEKLDLLEQQVEERAFLTIAKRQPMAKDLRDIMVAIRISSDLERIGDLAKNIAKRVHALPEPLPRKLASGLTRLGKLTQQQLKDVLDAYSGRSSADALEVWRADEDIDSLFNSIFRELLTYMMEDPRMIGACTHLLFAAKNVERIGDHATNIAENVYYMVHGKTIKETRPKKDTTSITAYDSLNNS